MWPSDKCLSLHTWGSPSNGLLEGFLFSSLSFDGHLSTIHDLSGQKKFRRSGQGFCGLVLWEQGDELIQPHFHTFLSGMVIKEGTDYLIALS